MGNIYHSNAKTTAIIRAEIQDSKESLLVLAERYRLNPKTIQKWRTRTSLADGKSGPKEPKSALTPLEQASICEFRRLTRFSLDDVFIALKDKIPPEPVEGAHALEPASLSCAA